MNKEFCGRVMRNKTVWAFVSCFLGFQLIVLINKYFLKWAICNNKLSYIVKSHS